MTLVISIPDDCPKAQAALLQILSPRNQNSQSCVPTIIFGKWFNRACSNNFNTAVARLSVPNDIDFESEKFQCVFAVGTHDENLGASLKVWDGPVSQTEVLNAHMTREKTEGRHNNLVDWIWWEETENQFITIWSDWWAVARSTQKPFFIFGRIFGESALSRLLDGESWILLMPYSHPSSPRFWDVYNEPEQNPQKWDNPKADDEVLHTVAPLLLHQVRRRIPRQNTAETEKLRSPVVDVSVRRFFHSSSEFSQFEHRDNKLRISAI
jgi:hypothetical protein